MLLSSTPPVRLSSYPPVLLPYCPTVLLSSSLFVLLSSCLLVLFSSVPVLVSFCSFFIRPPLLSCPPVFYFCAFLSFCSFVFISKCPPVFLSLIPPMRLSSCPPFLQFSCHAVILAFCLFVSRDIHSFIHSDHFYSAPSSPLLLRGAPDYSTDTVLEFHAEAHRQL